jgi:hypothetical protein
MRSNRLLHSGTPVLSVFGWVRDGGAEEDAMGLLSTDGLRLGVGPLRRARVACVLAMVAGLAGVAGCTADGRHAWGRSRFDVRTFGALGDGTTKDTAAFQRAIDAAAETGGDVIVPQGDYLIGSIALRSNVTLRLEGDSVLRGSPDLADYPVVRGRWEGRWADVHRALVWAEGAHDVAVIGKGKIIGNPTLGGRQMPRRPCVVEMVRCQNVRLEGFEAEQRLMWTIHPTLCDDVVVRDVEVRSVGVNSDGIDVDSCRGVVISGCDIDSGDDCIAIKSGRGMEAVREGRPTRDVLITGCRLGDAGFACIGIGTEMSGGVEDVRIDRCTFTHAKSQAIYIKSQVGRGGYVRDVVVEDCTVEGAREGFARFNLVSAGIKDAEQVTGDDAIPRVRDIRFSDIRLANCGGIVEAFLVSPERPIVNLTIDDIRGASTKGIALANVTGANISNITVTGVVGPLLATKNVTGSGLNGAADLVPLTTRPTRPPRDRPPLREPRDRTG